MTKPTKLDYWSIFVLYASFWCWYNDFNIWKKSKRFFYFIFFLTLKWEMRWRRVCKNAFIEEGLSSIWKTISFFHFILTKWQIDKIAQIARAVTFVTFNLVFYATKLNWNEDIKIHEITVYITYALVKISNWIFCLKTRHPRLGYVKLGWVQFDNLF